MTRPHAGDLAEQVANQLQEQHRALVESGELVLDEQGPMRAEARQSVFARMHFSWRSSDKKILEQIRAAADAVVGDLFADTTAALDEFYASIRVPDTKIVGGQTVVNTDSRGRVLWKKDSRDREIEDWSRLLTGQDIEKCLLDLARVRLDLAPRVNELLLEAVYAKHIATDATHDAYSELVEGTIPDRHAHASRQDRQDRYAAYFRFYLWSQADVLSKELANLCRVLDRILYSRISSQRG